MYNLNYEKPVITNNEFNLIYVGIGRYFLLSLLK